MAVEFLLIYSTIDWAVLKELNKNLKRSDSLSRSVTVPFKSPGLLYLHTVACLDLSMAVEDL